MESVYLDVEPVQFFMSMKNFEITTCDLSICQCDPRARSYVGTRIGVPKNFELGYKGIVDDIFPIQH